MMKTFWKTCSLILLFSTQKVLSSNDKLEAIKKVEELFQNYYESKLGEYSDI